MHLLYLGQRSISKKEKAGTIPVPIRTCQVFYDVEYSAIKRSPDGSLWPESEYCRASLGASGCRIYQRGRRWGLEHADNHGHGGTHMSWRGASANGTASGNIHVRLCTRVSEMKVLVVAQTNICDWKPITTRT